MKLEDLELGSKVKFGKYSVEAETPEDIIWLIADKNHEGYPINSCTLLTEKCIDMRAFDAKEPDNPNYNRQTYGNNFYKTSNINHWLNSDKPANDWYIPQHEYDQSPNEKNTGNHRTGYDDHSGFLYNFTKDEINALLNTNIIFSGNSIEKEDFYNIKVKVFLLSKTEVGLGNVGNIAEGNKLEIFNNNSRIAGITKQVIDYCLYPGNISDLINDIHYWLRSPDIEDPAEVGFISQSNGLFSTRVAYSGNGWGVRPACNIPLSTIVTETPDKDGCYKVILDKPKYCLYKRK